MIKAEIEKLEKTVRKSSMLMWRLFQMKNFEAKQKNLKNDIKTEKKPEPTLAEGGKTCSWTFSPYRVQIMGGIVLPPYADAPEMRTGRKT